MLDIDILIESLKYAVIGTLVIAISVAYIIYRQEKAERKDDK